MLGGCARGQDTAALLDAKGQELPWSTSFHSLETASYVRVGKKQFETPYYQRDRVEERLRSHLKETSLEVPIDGRKRFLNCWSAVELATGEILICGGSLNKMRGDSALDRSWLFDSKTDSLQEGPRLRKSVCSPNLLLLQDGRILLTGGWSNCSDGEPMNESEIYDPETRAFTQVGSLCVKRAQHGAIQLSNGTIMIIGGETTQVAPYHTEITSTVEVLDLARNNYRIVGNLESPRSSPILAPYRGGVVVVGGWTPGANAAEDVWARTPEVFPRAVN